MSRETLFHIIEYDDAHRSRWSTVYDVAMLVLIVMSIVPLMFRTQTPLFVWFDQVSVAAFMLDYLLRWSTADLKHPRQSRLLSFATYPLTPMAIMDILSILPSLGVFGRSLKVLRMVRLLKTLRLFKFLRYSRQIQVLVRVLKKERKILLTVMGIAVAYIFVTALIMFNVESTAEGAAVFSTFFDALYWATTTLTTVGYGDISPVSSVGRFISMLSSLFGVAVIALPSGVITASYLDELREQKKAS
ncbi:MAG: ion transporter [Bacteroidales bacterium]|nr:ion transporter [Bacteroidales bacterium]MBQ9639895.1 ion transporter [Bacteroidales bacterium]